MDGSGGDFGSGFCMGLLVGYAILFLSLYFGAHRPKH